MRKLSGSKNQEYQNKLGEEMKMTEDQEKPRTLSRRQFMKGAAAGAVGVAAVGALGACGEVATPEPCPTCPPAPDCPTCPPEKECEVCPEPEPCPTCEPCEASTVSGLPESWDMEADVVIVGYGGAGAAAAAVASDAGASVLILEKLAVPGGDTALCGGAIYGAGTSIQKAAGFSDSAEAMKKYYEVIKPGLNRPEFIEVLSNQSAKAVEWLVSNGAVIPAKEGLPGITIGGFERLHEDVTPAVPRSHWVEGGGKGLFAAFQNAVDSRDISVEYETAAERLVLHPLTREVIGVKANSDGQELMIKANKAVIVTSGGWCHNKDLLTAYAPGGNGFRGAKGSSGSTGDGLLMAQDAGSSLWAMHEVLESMGIKEAPNAYFTPFMEYTMIVNTEAKRFISEGAWTEAISEETLRQPDARAFLIFDANLRARSETDTTLNNVVPPQFVIQEDTIAGLAEKLGLDTATLEATIAEYNEFCEAGVDPLGKTEVELVPVATAPFYAIPSEPLPVITTGGILTDVNAQVLNPFGEPIHRLYAAGEVTGGKLVGYPGCGTSVTECIVFGQLAGDKASALESWS